MLGDRERLRSRHDEQVEQAELLHRREGSQLQPHELVIRAIGWYLAGSINREKEMSRLGVEPSELDELSEVFGPIGHCQEIEEPSFIVEDHEKRSSGKVGTRERGDEVQSIFVVADRTDQLAQLVGGMPCLVMSHAIPDTRTSMPQRDLRSTAEAVGAGVLGTYQDKDHSGLIART